MVDPSSGGQTEAFKDIIRQLGTAAFVYLGEIPDPETGVRSESLESAKPIIDQLQALEAKTSGNLTDDEKALLTRTLKQSTRVFSEKMS